MPSRREILLEALDRWRAAGSIDEETHVRLAELAMDEPGERAAEPVADASTRPRGFGGDATQLVGGLLVGAGLVALVLFLGVDGDAEGWLFQGIGALVVLSALTAHVMGLSETRGGLLQAAFAAGFVPMGVGAARDVFASEEALPSLVAFAVAVAANLLLRGRGPATFLATACASLASLGAVIRFFGDVETATAGLWLLVLLGYLAMMLVWRDEPWASASAGLLVLPISIAFIMLLVNALGDPDGVVVELAVGLLLAALFGLGVWLRVRALVACAAAGLTIDAVVFAFDVGGPLTAVVVLLSLGGLLLWQGNGIREYLRPS